MTVRPLIVTMVFLGVSACSGASRVAVPDPVDVPPAVDSTRVETFDITPYRDEPVDLRIEVVHDVPEALMENRADAGIEQIVDGYRVQIYSSLDQESAAEAEDAARSYWTAMVRTEDTAGDLPDELTVYRLFRQPYYRVRAGDFVDRGMAERAAAILALRFGGAFVVPDQVTVRK